MVHADNIVNLVQSKWAPPVVFAPKKLETLRFGVCYSKFKTIATRYLYPSAQMDECIELEDDFALFSALGVNIE